MSKEQLRQDITKEGTEIGREQTLGREKTPREMYLELAKIFHPDTYPEKSDSDKKEMTGLMQALINFYERAKRGDTRLLELLYKDWAGPEGHRSQQKEKQKNEKEQKTAVEIEYILKKESSRLYEMTKEIGNVYAVTKLALLYKNLCREYQMERDEMFFLNFIYNEGWITQKEFISYKEKVKKYGFF